MRFQVEVVAAAPRAVVWDLLTTWERQPDWMVDAQAVHVVSAHRSGEGVTLRCPTKLLGFTVQDVMRVTGWREGEYLEVTHLGRIITGSGAFALTDAVGGGTRIVWWEEVTPPLGAFGAWGATTLVRPLLVRVFTRSLTNLARLAERPAG